MNETHDTFWTMNAAGNGGSGWRRTLRIQLCAILVALSSCTAFAGGYTDCTDFEDDFATPDTKIYETVYARGSHDEQ